MLASPESAETMLIAWCRTLGIMDRECRTRWDWARVKQKGLMTAQKVRTTATASHLLRTVIHIFIIIIPMCHGKLIALIATPLVSLVMLSLLQLAVDLEEPFGLDEHDVPWPTFCSTISGCILSDETLDVLQETLTTFNRACLDGSWDAHQAEKLFGPNSNVGSTKVTFDTGEIKLGVYLLEKDLLNMDFLDFPCHHDANSQQPRRSATTRDCEMEPLCGNRF